MVIEMEIKEIRIAENIKRIRKERGLSSAKSLCAALCEAGYYCSWSSVKSWESGHRNPTIDAVAALCAVLNVTADELIF